MKFNLSRLLDIQTLMRELSTGLRRLDFLSNFESSEFTITLQPGENTVQHGLDFIPSRYILLRQTPGNNLITDGTKTWSNDFAYLQNNGASPVTVKILFLR